MSATTLSTPSHELTPTELGAWRGLLRVHAALFKALDAFGPDGGGIPDGFAPAFAWGIAASAVTGWLAVWGTLRLIRTRTFTPFVVYRCVAGVAVLALYAIR